MDSTSYEKTSRVYEKVTDLKNITRKNEKPHEWSSQIRTSEFLHQTYVIQNGNIRCHNTQ